jgi:FkbM family methyltransferase
MFQTHGFWLPDGETHLVPFLENGPEFASGPTYQLHKLLAAVPHVKNFSHAVDVGAHCGLWTRPLAAMFRTVSAFEPVARHIDCWYANIPAYSENEGAKLYHVALGSEEKEVHLHTGPASTGDTFIAEKGEHSARMITLDQVGLPKIDFMKIDCEGFEYHVLAGGEKTIRRDKPVIIVEQKTGKGASFGMHDTAAVKLLNQWGAQTVSCIAGDYIMKWG